MNKIGSWAAILGVLVLGVALVAFRMMAPPHPSALLKLGDRAGLTDIHWAVWDGRTSDVEKLLAQGIDIDTRDEDGETPLTYAALLGRKEIVALLIAKGADIHAKEYSNYGTALHAAAGSGQIEIVKMLLAAGADVNARTRKGWTPLDCVTNMMKDRAIMRVQGPELRACAELLREHTVKAGQ